MMMAHTVQPTGNPSAVVIGGGPVGSYAALNLAKLGITTAVFEEHTQVGLPSHCAGHISIRSLKSLGYYPLPNGIVQNTFTAANFYSPTGTRFSVHLAQPVTCTLDRERFDQLLAKQAEQAGASYNFNSHVQSLIIEGRAVKGIAVQRSRGTQEKISSNIVVDAEGISSRLLRQAGLRALRTEGLVYAVEAEVENVKDVESDAVEVYLGRDYAPGFYGWLIPKPDGSAKLGLAADHGNPNHYLKQLMTKHPLASKQLANAKISKVSYHAITLGGPIERAYADGFLAVGDCASQVKPTTGGGVIFGMTCAKIAAETAKQALDAGDVSSQFLQVYQKRFIDLLRFDFAVMLRLRRFLNVLSDEKIDELLRFCGRLGVDRALGGVNEIDFQGKMMLQALGKPQMLAALAYFALLYLSANP